MEKSVKYTLMGLLAAFLIKSLIMGSSLNEVLLCTILASLTAFYETSLSDIKTKQLQSQINNLIEHNKLQDKSLDDIKSSIVSVKVSSGIRGLTR